MQLEIAPVSTKAVHNVELSTNIKGKNIKRKQKISRRRFITWSKIIRLWAGHGYTFFQGSVRGSLDNGKAGFNSF